AARFWHTAPGAAAPASRSGSFHPPPRAPRPSPTRDAREPNRTAPQELRRAGACDRARRAGEGHGGGCMAKGSFVLAAAAATATPFALSAALVLAPASPARLAVTRASPSLTLSAALAPTPVARPISALVTTSPAVAALAPKAAPTALARPFLTPV